MKRIYFVTSNQGKVMALQNRLPPEKYRVEQIQIELPEIQHPDVKEIVRQKARLAFREVEEPLVVQDSAFCIKALSGFPGPYIQYINSTIGPEGIIKLMAGETDRRAGFKMALAYADKDGKIHIFTNDTSQGGGTIAPKVAQADSEKSWSAIWKIYIPQWSAGKTLAELPAEEIDRHEKEDDDSSEFARFANWLKNNC